MRIIDYIKRLWTHSEAGKWVVVCMFIFPISILGFAGIVCKYGETDAMAFAAIPLILMILSFGICVYLGTIVNDEL